MKTEKEIRVCKECKKLIGIVLRQRYKETKGLSRGIGAEGHAYHHEISHHNSRIITIIEACNSWHKNRDKKPIIISGFRS